MSIHQRMETLRGFYIESLSSHVPQGVWKDEDMDEMHESHMTLHDAELSYEMFVKDEWNVLEVKF